MQKSHTPSLEQEIEKVTNPRTKADSAWKRVLDRWLQPCLLCFWPHIENKIDWDYPIEDLGQELQSLTTKSMIGKQMVDKLYKVRTKSGQETMVLLHIEVQGARETGFEQRLFEYSYKIYDRYKLPITPLVVLSDNKMKWRPESFELRDLDDRVVHYYTFRWVKLLDWRGREEALLKSKNPFENLIAIHLRAQQTHKNPETRLQVKWAISRHLLEEGWGRDDILSFYTFLDGVMRLPDPLELEYHNKMINLEKEKHVDYITSAEYFGIQKGMEQGMQQGIQRGMQQGIQQGIEKGMQQGIQKGMQQGMRKAQLDNAKKMLAKGIKYSIVKEITELSDAELESI
jgi:hypothetical protein